MNDNKHRHPHLALSLVSLLATTLVSTAASAQEEGEVDPSATPAPVMSTVPGQMDSIEQLFVEEPRNEIIEDGARKEQQAAGATTAAGGEEEGKGQTQLKGIADLSSLSEFKDVAVIQKRYLPKTRRFEGFGGIHGILNDKFFNTFGANARLGFYFTERYSLELMGMIMTTGEKSVTSDLRDKRGVKTTNFVTPTAYYGLDFKWSPLYGKMTLLNHKIIPFDLYFTLGGGMTNTNQGRSEPTVHIGTGQAFAITKSAAFRWDFSWNFFNAKSGTGGLQAESSYNNLFITFGASFFFPEASYR